MPMSLPHLALPCRISLCVSLSPHFSYRVFHGPCLLPQSEAAVAAQKASADSLRALVIEHRLTKQEEVRSRALRPPSLVSSSSSLCRTLSLSVARYLCLPLQAPCAWFCFSILRVSSLTFCPLSLIAGRLYVRRAPSQGADAAPACRRQGGLPHARVCASRRAATGAHTKQLSHSFALP